MGELQVPASEPEDAVFDATRVLAEAPRPSPETDRAGAAVEAMAKARDIDELELIRKAAACVNEVAYHWTIKSDRLAWSGPAARVLASPDEEAITTGRGYAALLDADSFTNRFETVMGSTEADRGEGVAFSIEYQFRPQGRSGDEAVWLEDSGRWFAGPDGRPAEVFGMVRRVDDRHERDQHLQFLGNCDPLTGMMNRGRMADALAETMAAATADSGSCGFMILAVSNLPVINDAYGFEIADEVIVAVGQRLRRVVRAGDAIGRYSGSKFGLILSDCSQEDIHVAAERFLNIAREAVIDTKLGPVWATLSLGGVVLPEHGKDVNLAMANAEEALAEAKRLPTDGFVNYKPSTERVSLRSLNARCAAEIVSSLRDDRLMLAFQPIVSAGDGKTVMYEALLRMRCDDGQEVPAAHLVPIAEKLGLVRMIDRTVVELAIAAAEANPDVHISLNVSGITATDPRWFGQLTELISQSGNVAKRLMIEITETVALHDLEQTIKFITSVRELGCRVAIDDFGAGYTSFKNLQVLDIDMVKIDGSFCEQLSENRDNQYFVRSLLDLARKFELKTVAEWVENEADAELLRSWGVDYLQGFLYGAASIEMLQTEGGPDQRLLVSGGSAEQAASPPADASGSVAHGSGPAMPSDVAPGEAASADGLQAEAGAHVFDATRFLPVEADSPASDQASPPVADASGNEPEVPAAEFAAMPDSIQIESEVQPAPESAPGEAEAYADLFTGFTIPAPRSMRDTLSLIDGAETAGEVAEDTQDASAGGEETAGRSDPVMSDLQKAIALLDSGFSQAAQPQKA